MNVLSLFSGIGGLDLGLEAAGMTIVAQSEIDPYACRVLEKHWPAVPNLGDAALITEADLEHLGRVDLVCGGFPCKDLSITGKKQGLSGPRTGAFWDLIRIIRMARPRYVLLENVPALLARSEWVGEVFRALAESGYCSITWDCVPASAVGAHHQRDRIFIIAVADTDSKCIGDVPEGPIQTGRCTASDGRSYFDGWPQPDRRWVPEPDVGRMAHGVPSRVDRLRGLGNAVVPQVAEHIGRMLQQQRPGDGRD